MNYTVSLRKRGEKWSYQILVDGLYHSSKSGFKTKAEAKAAGDKAAIRIKTPDRNKDTFKTIADLYIKDGSREASTRNTYESWLKVFEPIWDIEIVKLQYKDVSPIIMDYYVDHKYTSTKSMLAFGKSIVNYAIDRMDVDMKNPFNKVTIKEKSSKAKKKHRILTESEMYELFDKIEDQDQKFITMCFGLAGLRISEARGLKHSSFKKDTLTIDQQVQHIKGKKETKNNTKSVGGMREIPLNDDLKEQYKKYPVDINKNNLVIKKYIYSMHLSKLYRRLGYDITPHSLRHAYATMCIHKGIDVKTISYLIGDTMEMVMKTYAHTSQDMLSYAKEVLTKRLGKKPEMAETGDQKE